MGLVWADVRRVLEDPGELQARGERLAKRLAAKQGERDRYVRICAQGHISEVEQDAYLMDLNNQTDNLRLLLASVEEDTTEAFGKRKQLVGLLAKSISPGKKQEDGRAEIQIPYRFGPPLASDTESDYELSMSVFKNGSRS